MSFTMQYMLGHQVLVTGVDTLGNTGSTVLDSEQWDDLKSRKSFDDSLAAFDEAVEKFFAPLVEASTKLEAAAADKNDPMEYVVLRDAVEGVESKEEQVVQLTRDSIIIRMIEAGDTDRLVWVDSSNLGVLALS